TRIFGASRYDTALAVAKAQGTTVGSVNGKRTAILASGENFPDALAGGPLAYAGNLPILLTQKDSLSPQAKQGIQDLGIQQVLLLGGNAAVAPAVETAVQGAGASTVRLAGADRTGTATAVATYALNNLAFKNTHVNLATGQDFADALAG